jgi:hypothetical protein
LHSFEKTIFVGLLSGGNAVISIPSINRLPEVGYSNPANNLNNVVLPHPEGPKREKNSPSLISNETSSTAFTSAKCFEILLICINECS